MLLQREVSLKTFFLHDGCRSFTHGPQDFPASPKMDSESEVKSIPVTVNLKKLEGILGSSRRGGI